MCPVTGARQADRPVKRDAATFKHEHAVSEQERLIHIVRHQQHGRVMRLPESQQQRLHLHPRKRVEGAEGLVEEEKLGLSDKCPGHRSALGLATGEGEGPSLGAMSKTHLGERGERTGLRVRHAQAESDIVPNAPPGKKPRLLENDGAQQARAQSPPAPDRGRRACAAKSICRYPSDPAEQRIRRGGS
jgi:hypothetical protein